VETLPVPAPYQLFQPAPFMNPVGFENSVGRDLLGGLIHEYQLAA
jgi:hypothetical protein